jgi:hypothetical protein
LRAIVKGIEDDMKALFAKKTKFDHLFREIALNEQVIYITNVLLSFSFVHFLFFWMFFDEKRILKNIPNN